MRKLLTFSIIVLILSACTNKNVYTDFYSLQNAEWDKDSVCRFHVEIQDTLTPHYFSVVLRHSSNYAYRNLWLFVNITAPSGNTTYKRLDCELADDVGKWVGKGISIYKFEKSFDEPIVFSPSGVYSFSIRHGMRDDVLKNVSEVGIKLTSKK